MISLTLATDSVSVAVCNLGHLFKDWREEQILDIGQAGVRFPGILRLSQLQGLDTLCSRRNFPGVPRELDRERC